MCFSMTVNTNKCTSLKQQTDKNNDLKCSVKHNFNFDFILNLKCALFKMHLSGLLFQYLVLSEIIIF